MSYSEIIKKCPKCEKQYKPYKYEPRYDMYGMMGNGWIYRSLCDECWT